MNLKLHGAIVRFQETDEAWGEALRAAFGKQACEARYTSRGRGDAGSGLRALYDAKEAARVIYDQEWAFEHLEARARRAVS